MRFLGIDLAWAEGEAPQAANPSGVVALEQDGRISAAGWTVGLPETVDWIDQNAAEDALLFIDAPLVVTNASGQRVAERQVGQRYGAWKVSANSTNLSSPRQAGVQLRQALETAGWRYDDGRQGPPSGGRVMSECYPYATIVGAHELGYATERPPYKRAKKGMPAAQAWPIRTAACDQLIDRIAALHDAAVPIDLRSHPETQQLLDAPSPATPVAYKQREDLLDAAICAWTAAVWFAEGTERCQVLGVEPDAPADQPLGTIIAPARPTQRR